MLTLEKYKLLTGFEGSQKDARITALIPYIYKEYDTLSNRPEDEDYPEDIDLIITDMLSFRLCDPHIRYIASETIGDYSVTYAEKSSYPEFILSKIKKYARLRK